MFYVGKGKDDRAYYEKDRNMYWQRTVAKYGSFKICFQAVDLDEELAFLAEIEAISVYKLRGKVLANLTNGGEGVSGLKRKPLSKKTKRKLALANLGKKHLDSTKKKISESVKGNSNMKGKHHSEETKKRMSEQRKDKRRIIKYTAESLENMRAKCSVSGKLAYIKRKEKEQQIVKSFAFGYNHSL